MIVSTDLAMKWRIMDILKKVLELELDADKYLKIEFTESRVL
ncbi:MAG: hypothetical protein QNK11_00920 [Legionella sp.]|nr:hypothetical protein [Legionella sp.]